MNRLNKEELRALEPKQLAEKVEELRRGLLELRLSVATKPVKNFSSAQKFFKRDIALVLTLLRQKQ